MIHGKFKGLLCFIEQQHSCDTSMCQDAAEVLGVYQFTSFSQNPWGIERVIAFHKNISSQVAHPGADSLLDFLTVWTSPLLQMWLISWLCHNGHSFFGWGSIFPAQQVFPEPSHLLKSWVLRKWSLWWDSDMIASQKNSDNPWWKSCALPPDLLHSFCQYSL